MSTIVQKLNMVKEAEEKARQTLEMYRRMAEEALSQAREEVPGMVDREEAGARKQGELELEETIRHANKEAEELRVEYTIDRAKLLSTVARRHKKAVALLVDMLERGE